jgi:DNA-binding MarR family transcriptional regulator
VSALLDRMERAGFLRREISPEDRRSIRIWLEDRGRAVLDETGDDIAARGHDLIGDIPDAELPVVESTLRKLVGAAVGERGSTLEQVPD